MSDTQTETRTLTHEEWADELRWHLNGSRGRVPGYRYLNRGRRFEVNMQGRAVQRGRYATDAAGSEWLAGTDDAIRACFVARYGPQPVEAFDSPDGDWWECPCGNNPHLSGLYAVNPAGDPVEPTAEAWPLPLYACADCGRYGNDNDWQGGRVPVLGRITPEQLARFADF